MRKWLIALWLTIIIPFALAAVTGGPGGPLGHAGFHIGYIAFGLAAVVVLLLLRHATAKRHLRVLTIVLAAAQGLFILGQLAELLAVLTFTGPHSGQAALADPRHEAMSLGLTGPGLLLSALMLVILTIAAAKSLRQSQHVPAATAAA